MSGPTSTVCRCMGSSARPAGSVSASEGPAGGEDTIGPSASCPCGFPIVTAPTLCPQQSASDAAGVHARHEDQRFSHTGLPTPTVRHSGLASGPPPGPSSPGLGMRGGERPASAASAPARSPSRAASARRGPQPDLTHRGPPRRRSAARHPPASVRRTRLGPRVSCRRSGRAHREGGGADGGAGRWHSRASRRSGRPSSREQTHARPSSGAEAGGATTRESARSAHVDIPAPAGPSVVPRQLGRSASAQRLVAVSIVTAAWPSRPLSVAPYGESVGTRPSFDRPTPIVRRHATDPAAELLLVRRGGPRGTRTHNQRIKRSSHPGYHSLHQPQSFRSQPLQPHHGPTAAAVSHHDPHHGA